MDYVEISVAGVTYRVPSAQVNGRTVIATGNWLKLAAIKDEDFLEGDVTDPEQFVAQMKQDRQFRADIFTFTQRPTDPSPHFPFFQEWDSVAAIPIKSFDDWWMKRVSSDLRKDVRRAAKHGVVVRPVLYTDEFVRGIVDIYNETPIRQGKPFWHYKKDFDTVKAETATFMDRSDFLGAFLGEELIGFLKVVYVDRVARLLQIIAKVAHQDKRPANALIAKAVELCAAKHYPMLTYGKYRYGGIDTSLMAFKHRNGFEEILVPKYYVPLTLKGSLALRLRLQHGPKALIPRPVWRSLVWVRAQVYHHLPSSQSSDQDSGREKGEPGGEVSMTGRLARPGDV